MSEKGKKRAKALCKSVGILVSVEIDIEKPSTNKVTINLYDKEVMPLVDELYIADNTNNISKIKDEQEEGDAGIFEGFISQVEKEIDEILLEGMSASKLVKRDNCYEPILTMEVFNQGCPLDQPEEEEEPEDQL